MLKNFDNSVLSKTRGPNRETRSIIESNASIYKDGDDILSKYQIGSSTEYNNVRINPNMESYTTISTRTNMEHDSRSEHQMKQSNDSELTLKDLFSDNKDAAKGFETHRPKVKNRLFKIVHGVGLK